MAGDGGDSDRGVVGGLSKKIQTELGILVISLQQSSVDCLGLARRGLRADLTASLSRFSQH